jgi:TRAP-type C4-dicarboxylate transport system permease small subunit
MAQKYIRRLFEWIQHISGFILFIATTLTAVNTILRYFFNFTIFGNEEFSTYSVLVLSFLMFSVLEVQDKHLTVDVFKTTVKNQKLKEVVFVFQGIFSMGIFGVLLYYGFKVTATAAKYSSGSPTLNIPKDILFGITMATFAFAIIGWVFILLFNKRRVL